MWGAVGGVKSPNGMPLNAYRCQLTNYEIVPVFNVEMSLHLQFKEALRDTERPNATRSGVVTLSRDWPIQIRKIDFGQEKPFVFYIYNMSNQFAQISLPNSLTLQLGTENTKREIRLIQSALDFMPYLPPFDVK
jgi:hypothetical protein